MPPRVLGFPALTLVVLLIGLLTSRVTLVLHEFVGHAGVAGAIGSRVERYHLFLFAGGYVDVARDTPYSVGEYLAIYLGGLALELVLGLVLLAVATRLRRGSLARITVVGFATVNVVHACFYFAAGTFHGYGDGWLLHHQLGDSRVWVTSLVGAAGVVGAFFLARHIAANLRAWLPAQTQRRAAATIGGAVIVAAGMHAALSFGELAVSPSQTYGVTMRHESERKVKREVSEYVRRITHQQGAAPTHTQIAKVTAQARKRHRVFPFQWLLIALLVAASGAGVWLARAESQTEAPTNRAIAALGGAVAASLAVIVILRLLG